MEHRKAVMLTGRRIDQLDAARATLQRHYDLGNLEASDQVVVSAALQVLAETAHQQPAWSWSDGRWGNRKTGEWIEQQWEF